MAQLSKQYRYVKEKVYESVRVRLVPIPITGKHAFHFSATTTKIANLLYNDGHHGLSLNTVNTSQSYGGVIFQSSDPEKNLARAKIVSATWRAWKRYKISNCTCRIATVFFRDEKSVSIVPSGTDDCPVHGFG